MKYSYLASGSHELVLRMSTDIIRTRHTESSVHFRKLVLLKREAKHHGMFHINYISWLHYICLYHPKNMNETANNISTTVKPTSFTNGSSNRSLIPGIASLIAVIVTMLLCISAVIIFTKCRRQIMHTSLKEER